MLENFDKDISVLTESLARSLGRRKMIGTTVRGLTAAIVAATLGQFTNIGQAFAQECKCQCDECWTNGQPCQFCPTTGCPSNCQVCTSSSGCIFCGYASGHWVAYQCTGLGTCHNGYKICTDCKCKNSHGQYDCNYTCTCLSACICCNCCTPQDVKAEMERLALSA